MNACAIIVGFNHWHNENKQDGDWTRRFVLDLQRCNPDMHIIVVDNFSRIPYQADGIDFIRFDHRVGYAEALNSGLMHASIQRYDWYITLNNDCQIKTGTNGDVISVLQTLDENVLYGSGVNQDTRLPFAWQWSAWMCISNRIFRDVGYFDDRLNAAFEDFDYQRRAMVRGYTLDTAHLPIEHLDMHTRYEDGGYPAKWEASRLIFEAKHNLGMMKWYTETEIERSKR